MNLARLLALILGVFWLTGVASATGVHSFLPENHSYSEQIPTPQKALGFALGQRHPRYDQVLSYMTKLASESSRVQLTYIGPTHELRPQAILTISSEPNLAKLTDILATRRQSLQNAFANKNSATTKQPLVIWLGYSIHGDEPTGTSAAMAVAYHLAASNDPKVSEILDNTIIVIEPSMNPDGMDRFVSWVNTFRGSALNADPNHIEHHQGWLTGRTNHFGFDLNRDWLLLTQQESQHRLKYFHTYQPNVFGDFHEMAASETYFFQPGANGRVHPLTPTENIKLTKQLASFHANALDKANRLYFSEEGFDDFYYGKGSTYPDINGAVGLLFEQAGSKGVQQQTDNGLLTFAFGIENHVTTSLATIAGAWQNRKQLKAYQQEFYQSAQQAAKDDQTSGYLITEQKDNYRLQLFLTTLKQHQINAYPLTDDFTVNEQNYLQGKSYFIPLAQPQYRLIKALFSQQKSFQNNSFYDISAWTLPLAMNLRFEAVTRTWGLSTSAIPWSLPLYPSVEVTANAYAYAFEWYHYLAPKLLNALLMQGIKARVATQGFTTQIANKKQTFKAGSIVIPSAIQTVNNWRQVLEQQARAVNIPVASLTSGLTIKGVDIGSRSLRPVTAPRVLLIAGHGIAESEIAEMRFYLDHSLHIPVSIVEKSRLPAITLTDYSHVIMVNGDYRDINNSVINKLEAWLRAGGVLYAQKTATKWLANHDLLTVSFVGKDQIDQMFDTDYLSYGDKAMLAARKRISGAIFASELDLSHPLAYGINQVVLPLFKDSTVIIKQPKQPFISLASYSNSPLMSGFADKNLLNTLANNAAIVAHNIGKGRVIASADNLAYRGYWHGTSKVIANSLFFAKSFSVTLAE